jgi:hypothetical protein
MLTDITRISCAYYGQRYRPRYPTQRFCRRWCRLQGKLAEARSARRVWVGAGRPVFNDRPVVDEPDTREIYRRF